MLPTLMGLLCCCASTHQRRMCRTLCQRYSAALHQQSFAKCCPHSDVAHNWEGGVSEVLLSVAATPISVDPPLLYLCDSLPLSWFPHSLICFTHLPTHLTPSTLYDSIVHSIDQPCWDLTCHVESVYSASWQASPSPLQQPLSHWMQE